MIREEPSPVGPALLTVGKGVQRLGARQVLTNLTHEITYMIFPKELSMRECQPRHPLMSGLREQSPEPNNTN